MNEAWTTQTRLGGYAMSSSGRLIRGTDMRTMLQKYGDTIFDASKHNSGSGRQLKL